MKQEEGRACTPTDPRAAQLLSQVKNVSSDLCLTRCPVGLGWLSRGEEALCVTLIILDCCVCACVCVCALLFEGYIYAQLVGTLMVLTDQMDQTCADARTF